MILKSFLIEKNISLLDTYAISLFYRENIGLKDEIKFEIRNKYKDYEIINLNQDEVIKNKDLLEEQIYNISLFNKNKIIFINEVSDKIRKEIDQKNTAVANGIFSKSKHPFSFAYIILVQVHNRNCIIIIYIIQFHLLDNILNAYKI